MVVHFSSEKCEDNPKRPTVARINSLLNRRGPAAVAAASIVLLYLGFLAVLPSNNRRRGANDLSDGGRRLGSDARDGGSGGSGGGGKGPYGISIPLGGSSKSNANQRICPSPIRAPNSRFGTGKGSWYLCSESTIKDADVGRTSKNPNDAPNYSGRCVVYSFGMDDNLKFDRYMAQQGCEVHVFDPGLAGIKNKKKYGGMIGDSHGKVGAIAYHPYGLGYEDRTYEPGRAPYRWPGISFLAKDNARAWEVFKLPTIMFKLRTEAITVLKIDVGGGEWDVIRDLVQADWDELCLELHFPPGEYVISKSTGGGLAVTRSRHLTFRRKRSARNVLGPIDRVGLLRMLTDVADMFRWEKKDGERVQVNFRRHEPRQNSKLYVMDDMVPRGPSPEDEVA